jgi:deazaflavin-dependent oxidoreductase (nitroreductase family)
VSDDNPMQDFNEQIIEEFRANEGRVGAPFEGAQMVLLHHAGAKTGTERVTPLVYRAEGDAAVVFASKAGAPDNPDWFHNLRANPETTVEIGTDTRSGRARVAEGDERDRIWEAQKADAPQFAEYEANTDRVIPVVILEST